MHISLLEVGKMQLELLAEIMHSEKRKKVVFLSEVDTFHRIRT